MACDMEVKIGSWLIDNDTRNGGRKVKVIALDHEGGKTYAVWKKENGRLNYINVDRVNTGRLNGWSLAPETV